jgi:hypothetical protein
VKRWWTGLRVGGRETAKKNGPAAGAAEASVMLSTGCKQIIECKGECEPAKKSEVEPIEDGKAE